MKRLGVKYFIPDPINGGNSNTGPQIKRILKNISVSASIFNISPTTLYLVGKCCEFINHVTFMNPRVCEKFSAAAFACVMCDLGNYSNITANTHSLFCHASTFIQWAQMELGVSLGALTENSIEKGNRQNKLYRQLYCYHGDIKRENRDIFIRRLLVSDPFQRSPSLTLQTIRPVDSTFELSVSLSIDQGSIKAMLSLHEPLQTSPNL